MKAFRRTLEYTSRSESFEIYPIGDVHLGTAACDEDSLKEKIAHIAAGENRYALLMGDIMDAVGKNDPRFESGGLADWVPVHRADHILNVQLEYAQEMFAPIRGQIIGALEGNHESKTRKHRDICIQSIFCNSLGIENLTYSAIISLRFKRSRKDNRGAASTTDLDIYAHHGHGGGRKAGSKVNRIHEMTDFVDADVVLMGHVHERGWAPQKPRLSMHPSQQRLVERERYFGLTGTYLRTYDGHFSGYGETAGYPPTSLGGVWFRFTPSPENRSIATRYDGDW
jgi:predicted phosphodiesterase